MKPRDSARATWLVAVTLSAAMTLAQAFEPGSERVCTPSADGLTFECRDKSTGTIVEPKKKPVEPVAESPKAAIAPVAAETPVAAPSTPTPKPAASSLPSYLMQQPAAAESTGDVRPATAPVEQSAKTPQAVRDVHPDVADTSPADVQPAPGEPAEVRHAQGAEADATAQANPSAAEPAPASHSTVATPAPAEEVPAAMPEPKPPMPAPTAMPTETAVLPGASAFLALPANHFTLVLASERDPSALDGLIRALDAQASQLYLLKLSMPDGDWYSLCWSDFTDLDAARAARASLPADAPIRSGWPRRIGLLQKEIAR